MGSSRLPGKVMKEILGKTVLSHVIERVRQSKNVDDIIIATTTHSIDDQIVEEAWRCGCKFYRGSEGDVLSRYYFAAKEHHVDTIVRITSDCPLIDPHVIDDLIVIYKEGNWDLVTNAGSDLSNRTYPRGLDTEVFPIAVLEDAYYHGTENYQREHVTPYIYEHYSNIFYDKLKDNYSAHRWTLDTPEDFQLISEIYKHLYKGTHDFYLQEILGLFGQIPELLQINSHIEQKKISDKG